MLSSDCRGCGERMLVHLRIAGGESSFSIGPFARAREEMRRSRIGFSRQLAAAQSHAQSLMAALRRKQSLMDVLLAIAGFVESRGACTAEGRWGIVLFDQARGACARVMCRGNKFMHASPGIESDGYQMPVIARLRRARLVRSVGSWPECSVPGGSPMLGWRVLGA